MTNWRWILDRIGSWFADANWLSDPGGSNGVPQPNDTAVIGAGWATVASSNGRLPDVDQVQITLAGSTNTGQPVGVQLVEADLDKVEVTIASGSDGWLTPIVAATDVVGITTFTQGRIYVTPQRGELTIDVQDAPDGTAGLLHLADDPLAGSGADSLITVAQQSTLTLRGGTLQNDGFIQIEGLGRFEADTAILGDGVIEVENGGSLLISGAVGADQALALPDGLSTVVIRSPSSFHGRLQFGGAAGTRIDLPGIKATSLSISNVSKGGNRGQSLNLLDSRGKVLASFSVELINPNNLAVQKQQKLSSKDFVLEDLGDQGTRVLFEPQGPTMLTTSLPVPVMASAGTLVDLSDILLAAFGTKLPAFHGLTLLPTTSTDQASGYWGQQVNGERMAKPAWLVNGAPISRETTVKTGDRVQLLVGNNVSQPPQMMAQLTPAAKGEKAVFQTYNIWTVSPMIAEPDRIGNPVPQDMVDAADAFSSVYPGVVNTELCNWIADNVAAAAWATMPFPNASLSPEQNMEGGFWRFAYRSSDTESPVADWSTLVQGGDIVRMQWTTQTGHTTTVLGAAGEHGELKVYDNIGPPAPKGNIPQGKTTAIHDAAYWRSTTPDGITIYRLDPNQKYLITGTEKAEFLQGSIFDDLIRPLGGGDTLGLGPGSDMIEGRLRDLNSTTLRGFGGDDVVALTDLDPAAASVLLRGDRLRVFSEGQRVATIEFPGIAPSSTFTLTPDGSGGTLVALDMPLF
ncbi:hypothetical protein [Vulcanococcus limneticus]|uniref:hypothetical protein n=1 Tax=Vulcanococcus limneticus TaxID=2170428 RepID=UPI00398C2447